MAISWNDVLVRINEMRKHTAPEVTVRGIDEIMTVDALLLDLQEKILDDHGHEPQ